MTGTCQGCGRGSVTIDHRGVCARCALNGVFNYARGSTWPPQPPVGWTDIDWGDPPPLSRVPDPMERALADNEKKLARLKKFFAHAARREGNENESRAFALRIFKMLDLDTLPLRFLVMKNAEVRVIPTHLMKQPHNASVLRVVKAHQRQVFTESHRLKDDDGRKAIDKGWLAFDRHGYTVFVKLADVQVFF